MCKTEYRIKILGAQYAANPDFVAGQPETEEMHVRTMEMLSWLNADKPKVVLMAEPTNSHNPNAVMARAMGRKMGYVADEMLEVVHSLMPKGGKVLAEVCEVVVAPHGFFYVTVCEGGSTTTREVSKLVEVDWNCWTCDVPLLAQTETAAAEDEAQYVLDDYLLPKLTEVNVKDVSTYVEVWMRTSRHDVSIEAREACNRYIECLISADDSEMRELAQGLIRHRASMCSRQANSERAGAWWTGLLASKELGVLWTRWQVKCDGRLWDGIRLIDSLLRNLPGELFQDLGDLGKFFSRLYYMKVPRESLQSIVALLLLRAKTCEALGIVMRPLADGDYRQDGIVADLLQIPTTIERVVEFGKSQCVNPIQRQTIQLLCYWLRDDYEQGHSKEIEALGEEKKVKDKECVNITITRMTGNNAVYNENK